MADTQPRTSLMPGLVALALALALGGHYLLSWHRETETQARLSKIQGELLVARGEGGEAIREELGAIKTKWAEDQSLLAMARTELDRLKQQRAGVDARVREYEETLIHVRKELRESEAVGKKLLSQLQSADRHLAEWRAKAEKQTQQIHRLDTELNGRRDQQAKNDEMIQTIREQLNTARTKMDRLEAETRDLERKLTLSQAALDRARAELAAAKKAAPAAGPVDADTKRKLAEAEAALDEQLAKELWRERTLGPNWRKLPFANGVPLTRVLAVTGAKRDRVYLEGGAAAGLKVGDTLAVFRLEPDKREVPTAQVVVRALQDDLARCEVVGAGAGRALAGAAAGHFARRK